MRARRCAHAEAEEFLGPVMGPKPNPYGALTMRELLDGVPYLVSDDDGRPVGAYVLRGQGSEVWVQAAAGRADIDLSYLFDDLIEQHGAGFKSIAFSTHRRGLVKKALNRGFEIVESSNGYTMRKKLK